MSRGLFSRQFGKATSKILNHPPRKTQLGLEDLETRDVPSATLTSDSDQAPSIGIISSSTGIHKIASPNGQHDATVVNGVRGNSEVFEDGKVVWQQWGGLVGEIQFSPGSNHLAFVVQTNGGWDVIEDGTIVGSGYSMVTPLTFNANGDDIAYVIYSPASKGDEVVENGKVVSNAYSAVANLQFLHATGQVEFTGYQSQTVPTGILPMWMTENITHLTSISEWGYAVSIYGPGDPTPIDPVTVVAGG
jgi:hypothetical protein